jgi:hypothetical protein
VVALRSSSADERNAFGSERTALERLEILNGNGSGPWWWALDETAVGSASVRFDVAAGILARSGTLEFPKRK